MENGNSHPSPLQEPLLSHNSPIDNNDDEVSTKKTGSTIDDTDLSIGSKPCSNSSNPSNLLPTSSSLSCQPSVHDLLNLPPEETADLVLDVYNMFFLSELYSQASFYSIGIIVTKMSLYVIIIIDLTDINAYPFDTHREVDSVKLIVKLAQFFLIPVAIIIQEELMVSFFVFGNLEYTPSILQRHPGAHRWKYYTAHCARFLDGATFLVINIYIMLQAVNLLSIFLNFAALMFLQTIDNVALQVCLYGYWTPVLQEAARDVVDMRLARRRENYVMQCLKGRMTILWVGGLYIILVGVWAKVHFIH